MSCKLRNQKFIKPKKMVISTMMEPTQASYFWTNENLETKSKSASFILFYCFLLPWAKSLCSDSLMYSEAPLFLWVSVHDLKSYRLHSMCIHVLPLFGWMLGVHSWSTPIGWMLGVHPCSTPQWMDVGCSFMVYLHWILGTQVRSSHLCLGLFELDLNKNTGELG